jgi:polysaccharide export outer membrane protein
MFLDLEGLLRHARCNLFASWDSFVQLHLSTSRAAFASGATGNMPLGLRLPLLLVLLAALASLAGCGDKRGGNIPYNPAGFVAPDPVGTNISLEEDYRINPLDTLKVTVFQVPELSGDFDVDLTGNIGLPLVGNVKAVGLTTSELDQRLTQLLGAKYLQKPDVSVGVRTSSSRIITVDGAVRTPGQFPVNSKLTLLQVIALAHGPDESANPRRVAVFRQIQGQRMAAAFDLTSIRRGQAEDPRVYSGDIIVVDGSKIKEVQKQILQSLPIIGLFNPLIPG